jgi:integrase
MSKAKNVTPDDKGLLDWSDTPREKAKEHINKYSEDELNALLAVSDDDEADLIHTFLRTGCRDEEIVYLHWTDINVKRQEVKISEKPKYGWKVKDRESRIIPVEDGILLKRLAARRERQKPESHLVFPNTLGGPDQHLIRRLRKVAERAESKGFAFEDEVNLHRFRRTYASMMIAGSDLQTVSELLGHEDYETTARYLAPDRSKAIKASKTAFKAIK